MGLKIVSNGKSMGLIMSGTIKLYQKGYGNKPDCRVATTYYFDLKDRKRIVARWMNFYGSHIYNHYVQIAPGVDLRKKKTNG